MRSVNAVCRTRSQYVPISDRTGPKATIIDDWVLYEERKILPGEVDDPVANRDSVRVGRAPDRVIDPPTSVLTVRGTVINDPQAISISRLQLPFTTIPLTLLLKTLVSTPLKQSVR